VLALLIEILVFNLIAWSKKVFILQTKKQLEKAIEKAKKNRPRVEFDCFGRYRVSGGKGGFYTVICRKDNQGIKVVECTCKGGENGLICYHAAAALSLHIGLARQRQLLAIK
jgi:hypothetical protein